MGSDITRSFPAVLGHSRYSAIAARVGQVVRFSVPLQSAHNHGMEWFVRTPLLMFHVKHRELGALKSIEAGSNTLLFIAGLTCGRGLG